MAYQDSSASLNGQLDSTASGIQIEPTAVFLTGQLFVAASGQELTSSGAVHMDGTLSSTVQTVVYQDFSVVMVGVLISTIDISPGMIICTDLYADKQIQEIDGRGCKMDDKETELIRYRGDTYPLRATLGRNGNFDTTGIDFKMTTQIKGKDAYTSIGLVIDSVNGVVEFPFTALAVAIAGEGDFDIQGTDSYIYTYDKGIFALLDDVTK